jgi:malonyl-CoA decarboxylase
MSVRTPALERAVLALQHVPVGDPAAREHVAALRGALIAASDGGDEERLRFLRVLDGLDLDGAQVDDALARMRVAIDRPSRRRAAARLRVALEPTRNAVLRHLEKEPGGLQLLIDLRAALLELLDTHRDASDLDALDDELRAFLAERFDVGGLELRRLTWRDSAALLERLARAEAVHTVRGWFDLKDRLDDDRRVYAFFHPALPDVPLVFIEVALTEEFPSTMRAILNLEAPRSDVRNARNAVFYSISNCEPGLGGIPFGNARRSRRSRASGPGCARSTRRCPRSCARRSPRRAGIAMSVSSLRSTSR